MGKSKHPGHGTSGLIKLSNYMDLRKVLMNHVCIRKFKE